MVGASRGGPAATESAPACGGSGGSSRRRARRRRASRLDSSGGGGEGETAERVLAFNPPRTHWHDGGELDPHGGKEELGKGKKNRPIRNSWEERGAREERGIGEHGAAVALLTTRAGSGDARGEGERRGRPEQARHGASASLSLQGRRKTLF